MRRPLRRTRWPRRSVPGRPARRGRRRAVRGSGHVVADVLEEGVDAVREGLAEVVGAGVGDHRRAGVVGGQERRLAGAAAIGGLPVGDLLDAVLDAEGALGAADLDAPPAAEAVGGVAALAEQIADAVVGDSARGCCRWRASRRRRCGGSRGGSGRPARG